MNLPVIDIPVKLPFDVPLLMHPIFVHFAIAIPVIVFLLELANIKAKNRAVSVTSLFLLTLGLLVYAGAFFTGKADGSHAYALISSEAQEELKFHKLLGIYLVYGMGVLFLFKILAMLVKANWARDLLLVLLLVFIGVLFKQGKEGGELVYKYGVNVQAVSNLQDKIDDMEYQIEDLKKAAEAKPAAQSEDNAKEQPLSDKSEENEAASHETGSEAASEKGESTVSEKPAPEPAAEATQSMAEKVKEASEKLSEQIHEGAQQATEAGENAAPAEENTTPVAIPTH